MLVKEKLDSYLKEDAVGGVSAPMATVNNVPGVGNATPADTAATTGAQFGSDSAKGSGDRWDNDTEKSKKKLKKKYNIMTFDEFTRSRSSKIKGKK